MCNRGRGKCFGHLRQRRGCGAKTKKPPPCMKQDEGLRFRYTTHYNIPTYASPITAGGRHHLLGRALSACDSRGMFCVALLAPGFHCPRLAVPFVPSILSLSTSFHFINYGPYDTTLSPRCQGGFHALTWPSTLPMLSLITRSARSSRPVAVLLISTRWRPSK